MQEKPVLNYRDALPDELTLWDINKSRKFLEGLSMSELNDWTEDRIQTYTTSDDQRFRMVVDRPKDGNSDKAVVVMSEFGTNIVPRLIAKSRVIRDIVDPGATLVIQPSSVIGEPNMNYSWVERNRLCEGNLRPIIGRVALTMNAIGNPEDVTIFGSSQGAMIGLGYAADSETPPAAVSVFELPNIVERQRTQLVADFMSSGSDLPQVVEANFTNQEAPFANYARHETTVSRLARYTLLSFHPDSIATVGAMRYASAVPAIETVLDKGGSVVHAWGDQDNVSPAFKNRFISTIPIFESNPKYVSRVLRGMSHAATDFYALDGALARLAHDLRTK